jgi:O-antigen/teichoic acid export membrane protein
MRARWAVPTLLTAVGTAGLVAGPLNSMPFVPVDLGALFGSVLVGSVGFCFQARMRHLRRPLPGYIQAVTRQLSRRVYLVLGALVLFDKLRDLADSDRHDEHEAVLRAYFVYALVALVMIRIMAVMYWRRAHRGRRTIPR